MIAAAAKPLYLIFVIIGDQQFGLKSDNHTDAICQLVDWAEDENHPLTWDQAIDLVGELNTRRTIIAHFEKEKE